MSAISFKVPDERYRSGKPPVAAAEWPELRVEHRRLEAGGMNPVTFEWNELAFVLSGRTSTSRTGNGKTQQHFIQPGTACICPSGVHESYSETTSPIECLLIYLPPTLIGQSALADYDLDPSSVELVYVGGLVDPVLQQIAWGLHDILRRSGEPTDRLLVDGIRTMLCAHLLRSYTIDRWRPRAAMPAIDDARLKRVLDLVEARFAEDISLGDLAAKACLSQFHFARMFRQATGFSPHGYVSHRRVQEAQKKLKLRCSSLLEIALDTGFGSQSNFNRVFLKACGVTPGQYRAMHR
jgi:AraC family transcriptional regulator